MNNAQFEKTGCAFRHVEPMKYAKDPRYPCVWDVGSKCTKRFICAFFHEN